MSIESLQKKRADLCAAREQFVGQINRTNGAIDLLDDLIAEAQAVPDEVKGMENVLAAARALTDATKALPHVEDTAAEALAAAPYDFSAAAPAEMLPVLRSDEDGSL